MEVISKLLELDGAVPVMLACELHRLGQGRVGVEGCRRVCTVNDLAHGVLGAVDDAINRKLCA